MKFIKRSIKEIREFFAYLKAVKKIIFEKDDQGYSL